MPSYTTAHLLCNHAKILWKNELKCYHRCHCMIIHVCLCACLQCDVLCYDGNKIFRVYLGLSCYIRELCMIVCETRCEGTGYPSNPSQWVGWFQNRCIQYWNVLWAILPSTVHESSPHTLHHCYVVFSKHLICNCGFSFLILITVVTCSYLFRYVCVYYCIIIIMIMYVYSSIMSAAPDF